MTHKANWQAKTSTRTFDTTERLSKQRGLGFFRVFGRRDASKTKYLVTSSAAGCTFVQILATPDGDFFHNGTAGSTSLIIEQ